MVGVPVAFGDVGVTGLGDRFGERVIRRREAFAGGDDEDGSRRDLSSIAIRRRYSDRRERSFTVRINRQ